MSDLRVSRLPFYRIAAQINHQPETETNWHGRFAERVRTFKRALQYDTFQSEEDRLQMRRDLGTFNPDKNVPRGQIVKVYERMILFLLDELIAADVAITKAKNNEEAAREAGEFLQRAKEHEAEQTKLIERLLAASDSENTALRRLITKAFAGE